jgi:importin-5
LQSSKVTIPSRSLTIDEIDKEQYLNEDGWEFIPIRGQQFGIKTSALEEKCTAYEMLCCYTQQLKGDFYPYVPQVLETLILPGIKFYFHDGVRCASAKCLPYLVQSAKEANPHDLSIPNKIFRTVVDTLLERINDEESPDISAEFFDSFYLTVEIAGDDSLSAQDMDRFIEVTIGQLQEYASRKSKRDEQIASGEKDAEEDDDLQEAIDADEVLLGSISKSIHTIFKRHKQGFLPIWARMMNFVESGLVGSDADAKSWAICIIDDAIEFCNGEALLYIGQCLPVVINCLADPSMIPKNLTDYRS